MMNIHQQRLDGGAANRVALRPLGFVERSTKVFGDAPAEVRGPNRYTRGQTRSRSAQTPGEEIANATSHDLGA